MQQHEQPLAPTTEYSNGAGQPLNGEGPLSAGTTGTHDTFASTGPAAEPIPQTMGVKEAKSLHKHLEKEAKAEDSNIKHQIKEIGHVSRVTTILGILLEMQIS